MPFRFHYDGAMGRLQQSTASLRCIITGHDRANYLVVTRHANKQQLITQVDFSVE